MTTTQKTVFVGLSGGVDSSVAAARLIDQGYNVVGVFIKVWHPDWLVCNWEQERLDAMRVAAHLGIPFLTCNAEAAYRDDVATYFIEEYKAGRTPNPDVMCNQHVKFGRFLEFAKEKGADYIATGHYARKVERGSDNVAELHRGIDENKDQTYFLWSLTQAQLDDALFPVGDTPKEQIRAEAEARGIPVATKKDSQGICFLGHVDIKEFLSHYVELTPGPVRNTAGERIGTHDGALVYTLGQRHGFTIDVATNNNQPMYVVDRNLTDNSITVADTMPALDTTETLTIIDTVRRTEVAVGDEAHFQIRYRQTPLNARITAITDTTLTLQPTTALPRPAAGQSLVLYQGSHCLGGGILT